MTQYFRPMPEYERMKREGQGGKSRTPNFRASDIGLTLTDSALQHVHRIKEEESDIRIVKACTR